MSIARMSTVANSEKYFYIAADGYEGQCLCGALYHGGKLPGIHFEGLAELTFLMERIFDGMGYPNRTEVLRRFTEEYRQNGETQKEEQKREGILTSFQLFVQYRLYASWQGELIWKGNRKAFKSYLELAGRIQQIMEEASSSKKTVPEMEGRGQAVSGKVCRIAIESCVGRRFVTDVREVTGSRYEIFEGMAGLTKTQGDIFEIGVPVSGNEKGLAVTFFVKILFREHGSWQGILYWREGGKEQRFRSFLELLELMESAAESSASNVLGPAKI